MDRDLGDGCNGDLFIDKFGVVIMIVWFWDWCVWFCLFGWGSI